jgi:hypothetical protein
MVYTALAAAAITMELVGMVAAAAAPLDVVCS